MSVMTSPQKTELPTTTAVPDDGTDIADMHPNCSNVKRHESQHCRGPVDRADPRNLAGNPDSPQAVIFLTSITDVMMGS